MKTKNHKLNRAVQAMLFAMVERGMEGVMTGDKGKAKASAATEAARQHGGEAMWAVILTKELWKKGIW
jgi:protein SDA1